MTSGLMNLRKLLAALVGFVVLLVKDSLGIELSQEWIDDTVGVLIALVSLIGVYWMPGPTPKDVPSKDKEESP